MTDFLLDSVSIALPISAVIALLLLAFRIAGHGLSAKCRHAVWLIIILRLCIPFGIQSLPTLFEVAIPQAAVTVSEPQDAAPTVTVPQNLPDTVYSYDTSSSVAASMPVEGPARKLLSPLEFAAWVYICGMIVFAAYKTFMYAVFAYGMKRSLYAPDGALKELYSGLSAKLGIKRTPKLCIGKVADSPMLYGLIRPRVVLPESVAGLPKTALTEILTHELTHYKRRDLWIKLAAEVAVAVNWHNPLVHIAATRLSRECELACDECTLDGLDEKSRREYVSVMLGIIKSCKKNSSTLTTRFNPKKNAVKERFTNIMDMTKKKRGIWIIALAAVASVIAGVVIGCTIKTNIDSPTDENSDIDFSGFDFGTVDSIYIRNGHTGEETTVTGNENIIVLTDFINKISGEAPISARGRYGFKYAVICYSGDEKVFSIGFPDVDADGISRFSYGVYESVGGFDYPGYYIMHGADETELNNLMRTFTYDVFVPQPDEFSGKTTVISDKSILPNNTIAEVYQTAAYDKNPHMGWLFSIVRHSGSELISDDDNPGGLRYFATDGVWYYALMRPTDVQADLSDAASAAEYEILSELADTVMEEFTSANGFTAINGYPNAAPVPESVQTDENTTIFMKTQNGEMSYEELLTYPEAQQVIVAQVNEILDGYNNGTLPNPIENYSESEPLRVSRIPDGVKLPKEIGWDDLDIYIGNVMFPDKPILPVYDDMYPCHIILPLGGHWNLCVDAVVTSFERPENSTMQLFDLSFYYGDLYDKDDLRTYGFTGPYIHSAALESAVNIALRNNYAGEAYTADNQNRGMSFTQLYYKLLLNDGRYVTLTFDIRRENGIESYVFVKADEFDTVSASPYDIFVRYGIWIISPFQYLTESQRSQIDTELKSAARLLNTPAFAELFAEGKVIESGTLSIRIGFDDDNGHTIAATLVRFAASGDNISELTIKESDTWDDLPWKCVNCTIDGRSASEPVPEEEVVPEPITPDEKFAEILPAHLLEYADGSSLDAEVKAALDAAFTLKYNFDSFDFPKTGDKAIEETGNIETYWLLDTSVIPDVKTYANKFYATFSLGYMSQYEPDFETWLTSGDMPYFKTVGGKLLVLDSYKGVPVRFYGSEAVITAASGDTVTAAVPGIDIGGGYYTCAVTLVREDGVLKIDRISNYKNIY